jgi:hypothetical protein
MVLHLREAFEKKSSARSCRSENPPSTKLASRPTFSSGSAMTRATTRREMSSVVGRNGRNITRDRSGTSVGLLRLALRACLKKHET